MQAVYQPSGKAREYCENAVNLYRGCSHGCLYCYVPVCTYQSKESFLNPSPRDGILDQLEKEAPKFAGQKVLLCFTCDPYQPLNSYENLTGRALEILLKNMVRVIILTKGGMRSMVDYDLLEKYSIQVKYGATLTFLNEEDSLKWEPGAALPADRLFALQQAKKLGLSTWASLEPVIDPEQSLRIIEETKDFVDIFKIGKWNHDSRAELIDWKDFAWRVTDVCKKHSVKYFLKKDLLRRY